MISLVAIGGFFARMMVAVDFRPGFERAFAYRRRYLTGVTERIFWYSARDTGTQPRSWEGNQGLLHNDF